MPRDDMALLLNEYARLWSDHGLDVTAARRVSHAPRVARKPAAAVAAPSPAPALPARPSRLDTAKRPAPVAEKAKAPVEVTSKAISRQPQPPPPEPLAASFPTTLEAVRDWVGDCRRCGLCQGRKAIVLGAGPARARVLFVGEAPSAEEDAGGAALSGPAGELLARIIDAMALRPTDVFTTNIVKCRPAEGRVPAPEEIASCLPFLEAQIEIVRPELVVALGSTAATALTGTMTSMSQLRGRFHGLHWKKEIPVMPTFHPSYLLRNPAAKKIVWDDMKQVLARLEKRA